MHHRRSLRALVVLVLLIASGCAASGVTPVAQPTERPTTIPQLTPSPWPTPEPIDRSRLVWPTTEDACRALGGTWGEYGIRDGAWCRDIPTSDRGAACSDSAHCEGECLSPYPFGQYWTPEPVAAGTAAEEPGSLVGACSNTRPVISCYAMVEDGQHVDICAD